VVWVNAGKHARPDKLRALIQQAVDGLPPSCRTVLLLFGFCGNALVGVEAGRRRLVLPRAADCITIFTGSRKEREAYGSGTYFFTEGYLDSGGSIVSDTDRVYRLYGEKRGLSILKRMLGHYKDFAVINTGVFNVAEVKARVKDFAKLPGIPVRVIPGNLRLIDMLLAGEWGNDEFLTVAPGGSVTFEDTLSANGV
jgi:hypothetical protein